MGGLEPWLGVKAHPHFPFTLDRGVVMIQTMKYAGSYEESPFRKWWGNLSFIQQRIFRLCLSIVVMLICIPLYYLGLFGNVAGPLNPSHLGERLAALGVTEKHAMIFFLSCLIISVAWNWIFNLVSLVMGSRLTCNKMMDGNTPCGSPVRRNKLVHKKTGQVVTQYVCEKGHKRPEAHFHPLRKGTVSHTLWIISLAFCLIVFYSSYMG